MAIRPVMKQAGLPEMVSTSAVINQFLCWKFFKGESNMASKKQIYTLFACDG